MAGLLIIRDEPGRRWRAARREIRRVGAVRFADVVAFRVYARLFLAARDDAWKHAQLARLRALYPADLDRVPRLVVSTPNGAEAREFIARLQPDLAIARCKVILRRETFELPRAGTFVLHPGICPEYRNAHGCFWALANRDLDRVGMTLLRVDPGIDTGPVYLHGTCDYDEVAESHIVIQYRAVFDNLDAIGRTLTALSRGEAVTPLPTAGRRSAAWGQPQLTKYLQWKRMARRLRPSTTLRAVLSKAEGRPATTLGAVLSNAEGRPATTLGAVPSDAEGRRTHHTAAAHAHAWVASRAADSAQRKTEVLR